MKPCNDCPFLKSSELVGAPDWLEDVFTMNKKNPFFAHSCHKTDPSADGYVGGKSRECAGHLKMVLNEIDGKPGDGGVYDSVHQLTETYLRHWLGDEEFNRMKGKADERSI